MNSSYKAPPDGWNFCKEPEDPEYINLETEVGYIDYVYATAVCGNPCAKLPEPYTCQNCAQVKKDVFDKWAKVEELYGNIKYLSLNNLWVINPTKAALPCCQHTQANCSGSFRGCCNGIYINPNDANYTYCGVSLYPGKGTKRIADDSKCSQLNECSSGDYDALLTGYADPIYCK